MVTAYEIQIVVLLLVGLSYALFDVLNRRNVPNYFVYSTLVLGVVCAFVFNYNYIMTDILIAAIVGAIGYLLYVRGLMGGGDIVEFVVISLLLPIQQAPVYWEVYQFNAPFIISVIIAASFAALVYTPLYYLGFKSRGKRWIRPTSENLGVAALMALSYIIFIIVLQFFVNLNLARGVLVIVLGVASVVTALYKKQINAGMVDMVYPGRLEEGDMIAVNLMSSGDISYFRKRSRFGMLATRKLISEIKAIRKKIPVYRDSVPFAFFVFIGLILSLLFGNLILFMIGL